MNKYKIDFGIAFVVCIGIMVFEKLWNVLDALPELFQYGDLIYHLITGVVSIITQLAIAVAAAIIFYYLVEFLDKKKNLNVYSDLRKNIYFLFYKHLVIISRLDSFKEINERERRVPDFFDIYDIPILVRVYEENSSELQKLVIKKEINNLFNSKTDKAIKSFVESFRKDIEEIKAKKVFRYFKDSSDLIDSISMCYEDDFCLISDLYIFDKEINHREAFLDTMTDDYFSFLEYTILFFIELDKFITCIENKDLWTFIKMLD